MEAVNTPAHKKPARKQADRRDEAEHKILTAAIRLLVEKGYDRFSLAEVGYAAGYSRALPAHYFGKKEDLLSQVATYLVATYRESIATSPPLKPGFERIADRIRRYSQAYGSRPNRAMSVLIAEARFRPTLRRTITELNQQAREGWGREVRAAIEGGGLRPGLNAEAVGASIFGFLRGQSSFVDLDPGYDMKAATEAFIDNLKQGVMLAPASRTSPVKAVKAAATPSKPYKAVKAKLPR